MTHEFFELLTMLNEGKLIMKTTTENKQWHSSGTGNHQGLIIDSKTGYNIAVSYDREDAPLIAAAPDLLSACESALKVFEAWAHDANPCWDLKRGESADYDAACNMAELMQSAIQKANQ